jgi:hypothetical protein
MKKLLLIATVFCVAFSAMAQGIPTGKMVEKSSEKNKSVKYRFFMPMNEVASLKYYDKNNHACDEYEYSQVIFSSKDSSVYSVAEGEVVTVAEIEDMKVVIVVKGKLFVTYSNHKSLLVKEGDKI